MIKNQRHAQTASLLADITAEVRSGVGILSQLLGIPAGERVAHQERLRSLEGRTLDLHFALMTHIRSVFLTPLPREDIYEISQRLNHTVEHVVAAGDLLLARESLQLPPASHDQLETLSRQVELTRTAMTRLDDFDHLEEYWVQMQRLSKQANRTHRDWTTSTDGAFQPNIALQQAELANEVLAAITAQRTVAHICGSIIVRES